MYLAPIGEITWRNYWCHRKWFTYNLTSTHTTSLSLLVGTRSRIEVEVQDRKSARLHWWNERGHSPCVGSTTVYQWGLRTPRQLRSEYHHCLTAEPPGSSIGWYQQQSAGCCLCNGGRGNHCSLVFRAGPGYPKARKCLGVGFCWES